MNDQFIAKSVITINAPVHKVWEALINPEMIKEYMFGTEVISDWTEGSPIVWKGIWKDKPYEDKGEILKVEREKLLKLSHYSPLSGAPDVPESYHILTYELTGTENMTELILFQNNNSSEEEKMHSQQMWDSMLLNIKQLLEK